MKKTGAPAHGHKARGKTSLSHEWPKRNFQIRNILNYDIALASNDTSNHHTSAVEKRGEKKNQGKEVKTTRNISIRTEKRFSELYDWGEK